MKMDYFFDDVNLERKEDIKLLIGFASGFNSTKESCLFFRRFEEISWSFLVVVFLVFDLATGLL